MASVITGRDILLAKTVLEQIAKKNIAAAQTSLDYMVDSMFMELYVYQNSIYSVDDKNEVNSILRQTANYRMEHPSKWVGPPEFSQKLNNVIRQMSLPERAR